MDSQDPSGYDRTRTNWTPPMDSYFIKLMVNHVQRGNKVKNGFSKRAWNDMTGMFNVRFRVQFDKENLKNRHKNLRKLYHTVHDILSQSGFSWDEQRQMITADELVWEDYIKAHPDGAKYRTKMISNWNELCVVYGNTIANGRCGPLVNGVFVEGNVSGTGVPIEGVPDELSEASEGIDISPSQSKRRSVMPSSSRRSAKARRSTDEGMVAAMQEMAASIASMANKKLANNLEWMDALRTVPDMDDDLFLDACDLLEDERKAKLFMALDVALQRKWLLKKLRP